MYTLLCIIVKEFLQLRHDRKMIPVLLIGPLAQLIALGFAANMDVSNIPLLVVDQDRTAQSRELVDRFTGSGYFRLVGTEDTVRDIDPWLIRGRAQVALVIAPDYGRNLEAGRVPRIQAIADGTDANSAVVGLGYASRIVSAVGVELMQIQFGKQSHHAQLDSIQLVPRVWYNPDLKSRWFYVPAVLVMVLMLVTMILPSMAVVREKEIGTLEQIIVTPVRSWQLIAGKLFPFLVIGIVETLLIVALAKWLFAVPFRGSLLLLICMSLLFLMTTLGLGLLASTLVSTQQQAMMLSIYLLMVPMIYLSGLIFPIENMPKGFQYATYVIPVRYYANIIRGIFLKGSGIDILWPDALALAVIGSLVLLLASFRFRKTLD